jgi:hypothetical protein
VIFKDDQGNLDIQGLKESFAEFKQTAKSQQFKLEVMISFWFAIHIESLDMAQVIYTLDPIIEKVMRRLREQGEGDIEEKRKREKDRNKKNVAKIAKEEDSEGSPKELGDTLKLPDINKK